MFIILTDPRETESLHDPLGTSKSGLQKLWASALSEVRIQNTSKRCEKSSLVHLNTRSQSDEGKNNLWWGQPYHTGTPVTWAECSQLVCGDVEVAGKYEILRFIIKDIVCTQSLQSSLTLCNPLDCSLTTSSVHGVLQARIWTGLPCPWWGWGSSQPWDWSCVSCIAGGFFTHWTT